ncbi:hypothetical protein V7S43_015243 [Phytophthora oleae]|uniref:Uncharacterized protein n=1 Tax=Phytophthora oleae TaxID=2107226 RepID=A0ABD3EZE9_9STRA
MIRELAVKAKDDKDLNMKVLYTCTRVYRSTGYPKATPRLSNWLVYDRDNYRDIAKRLKAIFYHATENWGTVQTDWLELFTDTTAEDRVANALGETLKSRKAKATDYSSLPSSGKMVLVVFDEARNLLKQPTTGLNYFDVLQSALVSANIDIGNKGRIFGVLVDTNPWIADPSLGRSRTNTKDRRSFPPFVLTHSMDAKWQQYCRYKLEEVRGVPMDTGGAGDDEEEKKEGGELLGAVEAATEEKENEVSMSDQLVVYKRIVAGNEKDDWDALKQMGRPLWTDLCKGAYGRDDKVKLVRFAACKLMLGVSPWQESNYTVDTMFGAASMLCRLGVRPRWTSELAPLVVANFMAILAYVNYEGDAFLSSYASDPVLAFGAIGV